MTDQYVFPAENDRQRFARFFFPVFVQERMFDATVHLIADRLGIQSRIDLVRTGMVIHQLFFPFDDHKVAYSTPTEYRTQGVKVILERKQL